MIQIDQDECVMKVLDIDHSQFNDIPGFFIWVRNFIEYEDKGLSNEPMYPLMIIEEIEESGLKPDKKVMKALKQIKKLCDKYDCCYWRVINTPIQQYGKQD